MVILQLGGWRRGGVGCGRGAQVDEYALNCMIVMGRESEGEDQLWWW